MSDHVDALSISDLESLTAYTPSSASGSTATETGMDETSQPPFRSSIPWPGSTFIIRSASTGRVVSFQQGRIVLTRLGSHDAVRWQCVNSGGWIGFQDPVSSMFLGYDENEELCCQARRLMEWEKFCVRQRPEGGYILLMSHYNGWLGLAFKDLRPIGIKWENDVEKLGTVTNWDDESTVWEFIRV